MSKHKNIFNKIFLIFLYLQPFLDVAAGILLHYNYGITISSIIRLLFMFLSSLYLISIIKNKNINIYLALLFTYFIIFGATTLMYKGIPAFTYEIKNMITTYYFVIILITLFKLYEDKTFDKKHLIIIYFIYLILVFIPNILNIGFNSYWHSKEGSSGWFLSANVVGSILSILLPVIIMNIKKIKLSYIIILVINLLVIFGIGTKVPVLSFIIVIGINILYYLISLIKKHNYKKLFILLIPIIFILTSTIIIIPKTSFYKNIVIHINYLEKKDNGNISMNHIIDHFIFSQRLTFEKKTRKAYVKSNITQKIFGIGYIENYGTDNIRLKTVEIDYFDILYRHGIIGFILFFIPVIYAIKSIIKNFKYKSYKKLNVILVICLIFLLALFQGHIFTSPSNGVFVALVLSLINSNRL